MGVLGFPEHDTHQMCSFPPFKKNTLFHTSYSDLIVSDCGQQQAELNLDRSVPVVSLSITAFHLVCTLCQCKKT